MDKYQTFSKRFWAGFIDELILLPIITSEFWIGVRGVSKVQLLIWTVIIFSAYHLYIILMHGFYGQTLGKMVTKVKVIDISGSPITMWQSFLRDSGYLLISIAFGAVSMYRIVNEIPSDSDEIRVLQNIINWSSYSWLIADTLTFLFNKQRRAAHDLLARTVVVRLDRIDS